MLEARSARPLSNVDQGDDRVCRGSQLPERTDASVRKVEAGLARLKFDREINAD